jgi:hypothetical protein
MDDQDYEKLVEFRMTARSQLRTFLYPKLTPHDPVDGYMRRFDALTLACENKEMLYYRIFLEDVLRIGAKSPFYNRRIQFPQYLKIAKLLLFLPTPDAARQTLHLLVKLRTEVYIGPYDPFNCREYAMIDVEICKAILNLLSRQDVQFWNLRSQISQIKDFFYHGASQANVHQRCPSQHCVLKKMLECYIPLVVRKVEVATGTKLPLELMKMVVGWTMKVEGIPVETVSGQSGTWRLRVCLCSVPALQAILLDV